MIFYSINKEERINICGEGRLHDHREDDSSGEVSEEETTWPAACFVMKRPVCFGFDGTLCLPFHHQVFPVVYY